jgi:chromosome segregation ATPase
MPDEPDETPDPELETSETDDEPKLAGAAAQSALRKERKARADAERESKDLKNRLKKLEDADKSETERLRAELDELKQERAQERATVETERTDRERAERVRRAAKSLDFADEDDTVALLRGHGLLEDIDDDADAERVLKQFAKAKPHLVRKPAETESLLDKVLNDGKPAGPREGDPPAAVNPTDPDEIAALKTTDPKRYYEIIRDLGTRDTYHTVGH